MIDGQTGGGPSSWTTGFGFYLGIVDGKGIESRTAGIDHVEIRHMEIEGIGNDGPLGNDLVYLIAAHDDWTFSHLYLHDCGRAQFLWRGMTNSMIEYCYSARSGNLNEVGSMAMTSDGSSHNVIRYSIWEDIEGTGILMFNGDDWQVYGNVFFETGTPDHGGTSNGAVADWTGNLSTNVRVHNNTFINLTGINNGINFGDSGGTNEAFNNIFYNCETVTLSGVVHDYSLWSEGIDYRGNDEHGQTIDYDPFVNSARGNAHLTDPTEPGITLPTPFDRDAEGELRGANGLWDRGAFELK